MSDNGLVARSGVVLSTHLYHGMGNEGGRPATVIAVRSRREVCMDMQRADRANEAERKIIPPSLPLCQPLFCLLSRFSADVPVE